MGRSEVGWRLFEVMLSRCYNKVVVKAMIDLPADQLEQALKQAREIGKGSYAVLFRAITQPRRPQA